MKPRMTPAVAYCSRLSSLVSLESNNADNIGEKVRALNVEIPIENRIVAANCL